MHSRKTISNIKLAYRTSISGVLSHPSSQPPSPKPLTPRLQLNQAKSRGPGTPPGLLLLACQDRNLDLSTLFRILWNLSTGVPTKPNGGRGWRAKTGSACAASRCPELLGQRGAAG